MRVSQRAVTDPVRQRWILLSAALAGLIATLDDYIVSVSLPTIAHDFDATTSEAALVTLVYLLALVGSLLLFGRVGDRVGFTRVFLVGYLVFVAASALCAAAPSLPALICSRALQGLGAAMLSVMGPAIVSRYVSPESRGAAFGMLTTVTALGITLGAPLGGLISGLWGWHAIFLVNIPVGLAAAFAASRVLPGDRRTGRVPRSGYDVVGAITSAGALTMLLLALNQGEEFGGFTSLPVLCLFLGAAVMLAAFVMRELTCSDPLLDLRSLRDPSLSTAVLATLFGYMLLAGCNLLLPFYLIYVKGMTTVQVGLLMISYSVVYVVGSPLAGRLSDRVRPRPVSGVGMAGAAAASLMLVVVAGFGGLLLVIAYLVWRAVSYAAFISPNNTLVMDHAGDENRGRVAGLLKVAMNLSLVLGICLFETIFSFPLPEGQGSISSMIESGAVSADLIVDGIRWAYAFGVIACVLAACLTFAGRRRSSSSRAGDTGQPSSLTPVR